MAPGYHRPPDEGTETIEGREADVLALILLGVALVLGAARLWQLGTWSLWLDEAFTLADSRHREGIANPVGYILFSFFYGAEGRPDEFQLRLPAALFGLAGIVATWWAVRPFTHRRVAAGAALIVACSTWHLYWSQNARFYTLAQFAGVLAGALVLRGLWRPSWILFLAGFGVVALGALVHPSVALVGAGLLLAPVVVRMLGGFASERNERAAVWRAHFLVALVAVFGASGWLFEVWSSWGSKKGGGDPVHFLLSTGFLMTPLLGLGFLAGCVHVLRHRRGPTFLIALVPALPLFFALVLSFFARVSAQYVFAVLPWIAIVAALPLGPSDQDDDPTRVRPWKLGYLALLLLPMLADTSLYYAARNGDRPKWREAYEYVFDHRGEHDFVLGMEAPVGEYYLDPRKDDLRRWKDVLWLDRYRSRVAFDWMRYPRRTWLIVNREQLEDWSPEDRDAMRRFLDEECEVVQRYPIPWTPRDLDVEVLVHE